MAAGVRIGSAFIEVEADTRGAFRDAGRHASDAGDQAGKGFSGAFGKGLAGMGTAIAGAFAVDKIVGFVGGAVKGASDLNEETSKSQTIFGSASTAVMDWAKNSAKGVGMSQTAALSTTGTYGNMFTQMGFGAGEAAKLSTGVVDLSADLGSFNNMPTADVADMMGAAFRGEYDSIQQLLPGINAASVENKALEMTGKSSAAALTDQEKATAVLALANEGGAKAVGDFAKTQGGFAGQSKVAAAELENMSTSIGGVLLPMATSLMSFVNTDLLPGIKNIGSFIQTDVVPALVAFGNGFTQALPTLTTIASIIGVILLPALVASGIQMAITAAASVVGWVTMAAGAVLNAATIVGAWVMMGIQSMLGAVKMAAAWLIAMGPVGLVIAIIVGLVALIIANWDSISAVTTAVFTAIGQFLTDTWNNIVSFLGDAWNNIVNFITTGVNTANSIITSVFGAVSSFVSSVFNNIVNFISSAFNNAVNFVTNGVNNIKNFIQSGFNGAVGFVRDAFNNISTAVSTGIQNAVNFVTGLPGKITGALGNLGGLLTGAGGQIIEGFLSGLKAGFETVKNFVGGIGDWIAKNKGPKAYDLALLIPNGGWIMKGLGAGIEAGIPALNKTLGGVAGSVASGIGDMSSDVRLNTKSDIGGSARNGINAPASSAGSRTGVQNIYVTIDAKNVKDFNAVVGVFEDLQRTARTGRGTQNARIA